MKKRSPETMKKIRDFAEQYYTDYGRSPSTTMIANEVGVSRGTAYKYLVEMNEKGIISYDGKRIATTLTQNSNADRSLAPIVGTIRCGSPEEEREEIQEYVSLPASIFGYGDFYILKAKGDSMNLTGIDEGDLIVVEKGVQERVGDIVVALDDDNCNTKTRLAQIVQEGRFRGGCAPYGYKLVKNGRTGKKNRELYDIAVEPTEAVTVQKIFELSDRYGYGGRKISSSLAEEGIVNMRTGEPFHYSSIQNILRNIMYVGILRSGETQSEIFSELQIVEPEQFQRVEKAREQRSAEYEEKCAAAAQTVELADGEELEVSRPDRMCPRRNVGRTLLSGNVYCGHCGGRIFASTARKSHHAMNSEVRERIPIYKCYNRTQHRDLCDGPSTYRAEKVDQVVDSILSGIFFRAKDVKESELLKRQITSTTTTYQKQLKAVKAEYVKSSKELSKWEGLMLDSIEGTCVFTPEQVKKRMDIVQQSVNDLSAKIEDLQNKATETAELTEDIKAEHQRLLSWAEVYDGASLEEKKMVASYLIKAVTISQNYGIRIDFNITEAQYLSGMEMM